MNKEILYEDLFVIHNFLENKYFLYLQNIIKDEHNWMIDNNELENKNPLYIKHIPETFLSILQDKFSLLCKENENAKTFGYIRKFNSGKSMVVHADGPEDVLINKEAKITEQRSLITAGVVLYLNDDYTGGEINYPNIGIKYRPKSNDLIYHPSTLKYAHEVLEVTGGTRSVITLFIKKNI